MCNMISPCRDCATDCWEVEWFGAVFVCEPLSAQGIFWDTRKTRVVHVPLDCIEVPRHQEINLNYVEKSFAKEDDKEEPIP